MQPLTHFAIDVLRLCAWLALLAAIFVPLERLFALRPAKVWRSGIAADLGYYFLSSLLPAAILALPLGMVAATLHHLLPAAWFEWHRGWPLGARVALALLLSELGSYWGHRASHRWPWLWRFHAVHHAAEHLDWLVNSRAHPVDLVFVRLCALLPVTLIGLAQPEGGTGLAIAAALIGTVWGYLVHANLRWRFGPVEELVALPAFHHWHHTRTGPLNRNFATLFPWLDRLFGTLHLPAGWPADYGIDAPPRTRIGLGAFEAVVGRAALGRGR